MTFGLEYLIKDRVTLTFIIFIVLAVIRTLLDIITWRFLVWVFQPNLGIVIFFQKRNLNRYALSQIISFVLATIISYYSNKIITFADTTPDNWLSIFYFSLISIISLVISVWMIEVMTSHKKILDWVSKYPLLLKYWPMMVKIATIVVTLFINFFGQKYLVFKVNLNN